MARIGAIQEDELRAMGLAARAKVEREFSEEIVVDAYLKVLAEVARR